MSIAIDVYSSQEVMQHLVSNLLTAGLKTEQDDGDITPPVLKNFLSLVHLLHN